MKPLILLVLMLSIVTSAQAQTIADAARKERERQARVQATRVFTNEDAKRNSTLPEPRPEDTRLPPGAKPEDIAAAEAAEAKPEPAAAPDPVQVWNEDMRKLREKVRQLMDQETALQNEMNRASAQINAPVTTQSAKDQAARTLAAAQERLTGIRNELAKTRGEVNDKDFQGPPQPKR